MSKDIQDIEKACVKFKNAFISIGEASLAFQKASELLSKHQLTIGQANNKLSNKKTYYREKERY